MGLDDKYYNSLDRGYIPISEQVGGNAYGSEENPIGLSPTMIGISANPMKSQLESLKARIFQGASRVELGFFGRGKGSLGQGSTTPGMHSKEERQAIKELAAINKVHLSTHATVGAQGFAGLQQGEFSEQAREANLNEVKRAVDFAADVTEGGAVVIHTGEFPRSLVETYGPEYDKKGKQKKPGFMYFPEEKEKIIHYLVDRITGKIISGVKEDEIIYRPKIKEVKGKKQYMTDEDGNVLLYDPKDPKSKTPIYDLDPQTGNIVVEPMKFADYIEEKVGEGMKRTDAVKEFYKEQMNAQREHSLGQAFQFEESYIKGMRDRDKIKRALNDYKKLLEVADPEVKERFKQNLNQRYHFVPGDIMDPVEYLTQILKENERQIAYGRENATSGRRQAMQIQEQIKRVETIEEYAIDKSADTIARAGIYAMDKSKAQKLRKDLYISPENIFPEQYGSHPAELKTIVEKSRNRMAYILEKQRNLSKEEAKKIADNHIKATLDIGHAYTWKKYFSGTDAEFKEWVFKEVGELAKSGIIGHIHVSDNFGYEDEHVTPGQGIVPVKEFVDMMKKHGVTDLVVEPAHQDYKAMLGGWKEFGSSIYSVRRPGVAMDRWADIENGYFGQVAPPYRIVGEYSPSQDFKGAPFYSGVPLE